MRFPVILLAIISNLQSLRVAYATDVACGSIAVFGPTPLVVAQTTNTLSVARLNQNYTKVYRVHGNLDDTCADAYTVTLDSPSTEISLQTELTTFKGSEVYKVCSSDLGYATACSLPRLIPFFNPRQGAWKDAILDSTPVPVWSAPAASVGASFTLTIQGGTQSYTTLVGAGYTFWLGISEERLCSPPTLQFSWSQISAASTSLSITAPALAAGVYTLCMAILKDASVLSDPFPLSAILGHSVHNLPVGVPNTDVSWELRPVYGTRLQYDSQPMSDVTLIVGHAVLTDGWTYFGIDTSADICSPYLEASFDSSALLPFNSTHLYVQTVVYRPYGSPGGGKAVLCGARGAAAPWKLLSTSHNWPWVYACPNGYAVVLPTYSNPCYACPPNINTPCNNNGNCGGIESKTLVRASSTCICFPRYYSQNCDKYDLYPPTVSPAGGTFKTRLLVVSIEKPPTATLAVLQFSDGSQFVCSTSVCRVTFRASTTFRTKTTATNGSASLVQQSFTFNIAPPTDSSTLTVTASLSFSSAKSDTATKLRTVVPTVSHTVSHSKQVADSRTSSVTLNPSRQGTQTVPILRSRTLSSNESEVPEVPQSTASWSLSAYLVSKSATSSLPPEEGEFPPQTSAFIEITASTQYQAFIPNRDAFLRFFCASSACTNGLHLTCDSLTVEAIFVAPEPHRCNATFQRADSNISSSYSWEIRVKPLPVTRDNVLFFLNPRIATVYRYRAASIPYLLSSQEVLLRPCASTIWNEETVHLQAQQSCVVANVSALGFSELQTTIRDGTIQVAGDAANSMRQTFVEAALTADRLAIKKTLSPGGLFLGVAFGVLAILSIFSFP